MTDTPLEGKHILFLAAQTPFPPDGGGAIRNLAFLTYLTNAGADVTLLCFGRSRALDDLAMAHLDSLCQAITIVPQPPARSTRARLGDLLRGKADMSKRLYSPLFIAKLHEFLRTQTWDAIHLQGLEIAAPYMWHVSLTKATLDLLSKNAPAPKQNQPVTPKKSRPYRLIENVTVTYVQPETPPPLVILDEFNAEYLLQRRAAATDFAEVRAAPKTALKKLPRAFYSWLQSRRLVKVEKSCMWQATKVIVTSPADRAALTAIFRKELNAPAPVLLSIEQMRNKTGLRALLMILRGLRNSFIASIQKTIPDKIHLIQNGVDGDYFAPQPDVAEVGGRLIFTGTLDYRPNIDAVTWFVQAILPQIRAARPDAEFWIVGRKPTDAVLALAGAPGVVIIADVPDVRPLIAGAAVYVVPMRMGGGVRFKALEALAMGKAVVSTRFGVDGLDLTAGRDVIIEDEAAAFARAVLRLLDDTAQRAELGATGRDSILRGYDWRNLTPRLLDLYGVDRP